MRQELKYFGSAGELRSLLMSQRVFSHHPSRIINSIYFDDDSLTNYHDSEEGTVTRKKVRFRWYGNSFDAVNNKKGQIEVKYTFPSHREKVTLNINSNNPNSITSIACIHTKQSLHPVSHVSYTRDYFINKKGIRYTIDSNISYSRVDGNLKIFASCKANIAILELKIDLEHDFDELTAKFSHKRIRYSKYCQSVNALYKELLQKI